MPEVFGAVGEERGAVAVSSSWDGKISNLNISQQAFPELHDELSKMQHKARSDRLRALALLGLYSLRISGNIGFLAQQSIPKQFVCAQTESKLNARRNALKGKLMGSV